LYTPCAGIGDQALKQSWSVTVSVNQHGDVQPIGGVNEKIEGFFDICKAKGLTGQQGVLIPKANEKNLMLRSDVVEAVGEGQFHIHSVESIDEGMEMLTGKEMGKAGEDGSYPEGTINYHITRSLNQMAQNRKEFAKSEGNKK